ncbi:metal ABC transporter ATP-binding protein [Propionispora vibrioides]|uniref:Zinc transport system ATP-binding protein n=1 Tax=Propionispora vibrioides TaxID=112903 RepID=A0A1H8XIG2_9FIRM|nr:ATP-binding cassette domain-containing protein [Propionispora vibrioides]SEP39551.1 zinc transport system ATP-binding protein [Propionispora vibrioides]
MYAFELEDVMFAYPNNIVLEKLNFKVELGDFVAMIGPNGAGKSTVLKLCVGILKPISGQVKILGELAAQFQNWKQIAYISQNPLRERSFPATVAEVVAMGRAAALGLGNDIKKEDREIIQQSLEWVGMYEHRRDIIGRLSGGQQQRVMIARALAAQAAILVLDEPTAGIDSMATNAIYGLLKKLNTSLETTIVVVSHDVDGIAQYADKVIKINKGVEYYGSSETFRKPDGLCLGLQTTSGREPSDTIGDGSHA